MKKAKKLMPVIKWTGSKRSQAETIVSYFPENIKNNIIKSAVFKKFPIFIAFFMI